MAADKVDTRCREIIAKAVCARGRGTVEVPVEIDPGRQPETVLGCRIPRQSLVFSAHLHRDTAAISGEFQIQVWVAFDSDSELIRERVAFKAEIPLRDVGEGCVDPNPEIRVEVVDGPDCTDVAVDKNGRIDVVAEIEFRVTVFGETRLRVLTCDPDDDGDDRDDDTWDWSEDDGGDES